MPNKKLSRTLRRRLMATTPGPQQRLQRARGGAFVAAVAFLAVLLLGRNFVATNYGTGWTHDPTVRLFLSYSFFSNDALVALLGAVVGAGYLARQISLSLTPHVVFSSGVSGTPNFPIPAKTGPFWVVDVVNSGIGPAIVVATEYIIERKQSIIGWRGTEFDQARQIFLEHFKEYKEFALYRLSPGAALSPGKPIRIFECDLPKLNGSIQRVDINLVYRDMVGGLYSKRIVCIPEYWSS